MGGEHGLGFGVALAQHAEAGFVVGRCRGTDLVLRDAVLDCAEVGHDFGDSHGANVVDWRGLVELLNGGMAFKMLPNIRPSAIFGRFWWKAAVVAVNPTQRFKNIVNETNFRTEEWQRGLINLVGRDNACLDLKLIRIREFQQVSGWLAEEPWLRYAFVEILVER